MPKKESSPSGNAREEKRRPRWLLYRKPKVYPSRPISNKKDVFRPIRRSWAMSGLFIEPSTSKQ